MIKTQSKPNPTQTIYQCHFPTTRKCKLQLMIGDVAKNIDAISKPHIIIQSLVKHSAPESTVVRSNHVIL